MCGNDTKYRNIKEDKNYTFYPCLIFYVNFEVLLPHMSLKNRTILYSFVCIYCYIYIFSCATLVNILKVGFLVDPILSHSLDINLCNYSPIWVVFRFVQGIFHSSTDLPLFNILPLSEEFPILMS